MIFPILFFLLFFSYSCTVQSDAFVFVEKKIEGRTEEGFYFVDVTIKNTGEQPAYFVILISEAYKNGKAAQRIEQGYGDIFPNSSKQKRIIFSQLGIEKPDSINLRITYSPYQQ